MANEINSGYFFDEDGVMTRKDVQEVGSVVDQNTRERNSGDHDQRGKNGRKFAAIPMLILEKCKAEGLFDWNNVGTDPHDTGAFLAWLQENHAWRTSEARLGNGHSYVR